MQKRQELRKDRVQHALAAAMRGSSPQDISTLTISKYQSQNSCHKRPYSSWVASIEPVAGQGPGHGLLHRLQTSSIQAWAGPAWAATARSTSATFSPRFMKENRAAFHSLFTKLR